MVSVCGVVDEVGDGLCEGFDGIVYFVLGDVCLE